MHGGGKGENKISHELAVTVIYSAGNEEAGARVQQEQMQEPGMGLHERSGWRGLWSLIQTRCLSWPCPLPPTHTNPQAHFLKPQPPWESKFRSFSHPHQLHLKSCFNVSAHFGSDPSHCSRAWIPKGAQKPELGAANLRCQTVPLLLHSYGYLAAKSSTLPQSPIPLYPPPQLHHPRSLAHPVSSFPTHPEHQESLCPSKGRGKPIFFGLGSCSHEAFVFPNGSQGA